VIDAVNAHDIAALRSLYAPDAHTRRRLAAGGRSRPWSRPIDSRADYLDRGDAGGWAADVPWEPMKRKDAESVTAIARLRRLTVLFERTQPLL
jgi:hypothetical protein